MRKQTNQLWVGVYAFALAMALALASHPGPASRSATGMAAPSAPRTAIESAASDKLLPPHFDWCTPAPGVPHFSLVLHVAHTGDGAGQDSRSSWRYGPLRQRPPPSLS
ncbi:MAG TPA: hypothetical protein VNH18_06615 [Bryobacteraceae bacterium]|nr:hypothetical protein [Bryobacteraceae bacterium]